MRNGEPNMYAGLCASRNTTIQVLWSGMQAFLAFNSIALPITFGGQQTELVKLLISLFGLFMHLGFVLASRFATRLLKFWDESLAELERLDQENDSNEGSRVAVFSHVSFWRHQEWPRLQFYVIPFTTGMILWAYEVIVHLQLMLKGGPNVVVYL